MKIRNVQHPKARTQSGLQDEFRLNSPGKDRSVMTTFSIFSDLLGGIYFNILIKKIKRNIHYSIHRLFLDKKVTNAICRERHIHYIII